MSYLATPWLAEELLDKEREVQPLLQELSPQG